MCIREVSQNCYQELIRVWESSVRAKYDFLTDDIITELKPLILKHIFDATELLCYTDIKNRILGFIGVSESNIEMLFIDAEYFDKEIERELIQ
mgnify:CR=1 FL=1|tara:strand:- start:808 stop:1086 length:279 start_codon:yes stop_codon:yes gene_type:complete